MSRAMQLKARIKNIAAESNLSAPAVLQSFMLERLLERIALSQYQNCIVLKGGMLIASLVGIQIRTTMDMDATLRDYPLSQESLLKAFSEICEVPIDDQVTFSLERIETIREDDPYGGYRLALMGRYDSIHVPLKVDVTTGDRMTPGAVRYSFSSSFEKKTIDIWAYNIETVLAEKVETILRRSVLNTRPRDFYDVYILVNSQQHPLDHNLFRAALRATSENRASQSALEHKDEILRAIQSDKTMQERWQRYQNTYAYARGIAFDQVMDALFRILT